MTMNFEHEHPHADCVRAVDDLHQTMCQVASALRMVSADVRAAGDMALVRLSEEGVTPENISLADELWLYALLLDGRMSDAEGVSTDG